MSYRINLIGAGARGTIYMNMIQKYFPGEFIMDTVYDPIADRMDKAYQTYGFKNKAGSWESAASNGADIAIVATPAFYHCDIANLAMRCGSNILTEKPFDMSLAKCFALAECQKQTGKALAVGMQYRNNRGSRVLKRTIDSGVFGDNIMMHFSDIREVRPKPAMHDLYEGNGGPMVDMSCHWTNLMCWYFGCDPVSVYSKWSVIGKDDERIANIKAKAPDSCFVIIEFENGVIGNFNLCWGHPEKVNASGAFPNYMYGSAGLLTKTPEGRQGVMVKGGEIKTFDILPEDEDDLINAERAVFKHLLAEIEGRGKAQASIREGVVALAASMAAIRSSVVNRPVTLEEIYQKKPTIAQCAIPEEWDSSGICGV